MSEHQARILWNRLDGEHFLDLRYSRAHRWRFDGGVEVPASSAVSSVPLPFSIAANVDPEEAFVAAISSCHLLTFLYLAARDGWVIDAYDDLAQGTMSRDSRGRMAVTRVQLNPAINFSGDKAPTDGTVEQLHHSAHEACYIANSVLSEVIIAGTWTYAHADPGGQFKR